MTRPEKFPVANPVSQPLKDPNLKDNGDKASKGKRQANFTRTEISACWDVPLSKYRIKRVVRDVGDLEHQEGEQ